MNIDVRYCPTCRAVLRSVEVCACKRDRYVSICLRGADWGESQTALAAKCQTVIDQFNLNVARMCGQVH